MKYFRQVSRTDWPLTSRRVLESCRANARCIRHRQMFPASVVCLRAGVRVEAGAVRVHGPARAIQRFVFLRWAGREFSERRALLQSSTRAGSPDLGDGCLLCLPATVSTRVTGMDVGVRHERGVGYGVASGFVRAVSA